MMRSSGGSFGLQIGAQATDFVIMVMNEAGARSVMKGNAKLGADASIAAGPVGKAAEASTTGTMQAQMLSYSRSKGVFGGVSLSGTSLAPDNDDNETLYGKKVTAEEIFSEPYRRLHPLGPDCSFGTDVAKKDCGGGKGKVTLCQWFGDPTAGAGSLIEQLCKGRVLLITALFL